MKLVVMGGGGVGKSCITMRFTQGKFLKKYDPTIEDFYHKQLDVDGSVSMLDILDTAGQEEFSGLTNSYMQSGDGFILVYSVDAMATLEQCQKIKDRICRIKGTENVPIVLVGNKIDLETREISTEQGQEKAAAMNCELVECSAKENINIQEIFVKLV